MTALVHHPAAGLQHPASGSHLPWEGTALPSAVAPQKPEYKSEEDDE